MLTKAKIGAVRDALVQAAHTLDTKSSSIGSWLLLVARKDKLFFYSTNMGLARTFIKIPAETTKEGEARINAKLLQNTLNGLPDDEDVELMLSASGARLQIRYGSIQGQIAVTADGPTAAEVLKTIPFDAKSSATVSTTALADIVSRVLFCAATNDGAISQGPWLSSILLQVSDDVVLARATNTIIGGEAQVHDGMATGSYTGGLHRGALLALKALLSKRKEEEVTITNVVAADGQSNETILRFSDTILGVRQLSKPYPKAVSDIFICPEAFKTTKADRKTLLSVFGRLAAYADDNIFTVTLKGDKLILYSRGRGGIFEEQVPLADKVEGTLTVALSTGDFINVLTAMGSEEVTFRFMNEKDPLHMREANENYKYVLSPGTPKWNKK